MQKSSKTSLYLAGLLAMPVVTACGDMQQPAAVVENSKKKVDVKDAAAMAKLMTNVKSGFGETNFSMSASSFDKN